MAICGSFGVWVGSTVMVWLSVAVCPALLATLAVMVVAPFASASRALDGTDTLQLPFACTVAV